MSGIQAWDDTPSMEEQFGEIPAMPIEDTRPFNCRHRQQDEGRAYPRSSCAHCGKTITTGLGRHCEFGSVIASPAMPIEELKPSLRDIANAINVARYQTPGGLPAKEVEEEDRQGRDYSYRLARAVQSLYTHPLAPEVPDTGLVERLTAERDKWKQYFDECAIARDASGYLGTVPQCIEHWEASATANERRAEAAEQREAAAREQIAALEQEVWRLQSKLGEVFDYDARDSAK